MSAKTDKTDQIEKIEKSLMEKYNKFVNLKDADISKKLLELPNIISYYQNLFFLIKKKYDKITIEIDEMWMSKYLYYKNDFDFTLNNSEIKSFIEKDLEIINKKKKSQSLKTILNQIEEILKGLESFRWTLKSYIDWEKFKAGEY